MTKIFQHDLRPMPGSRKERKRVGRGEGSGLGKSAGRGTKGSNARSGGKVSPRYEGGQMPLHMRLPKLRGPYAKKAMSIGPFRTRMTPVNLSRLDVFGPGEVVSPETLRERGIIKSENERVKILADGDISYALNVRAHGVSAAARAKIEAAGGTVEII